MLGAGLRAATETQGAPCPAPCDDATAALSPAKLCLPPPQPPPTRSMRKVCSSMYAPLLPCSARTTRAAPRCAAGDALAAGRASLQRGDRRRIVGGWRALGQSRGGQAGGARLLQRRGATHLSGAPALNGWATSCCWRCCMTSRVAGCASAKAILLLLLGRGGGRLAGLCCARKSEFAGTASCWSAAMGGSNGLGAGHAGVPCAARRHCKLIVDPTKPVPKPAHCVSRC